MKKIILAATTLILTGSSAFAQDNAGNMENKELTRKNSWLKVGLNAGLPIGNTSDFSSFTAGIDVSGQFMSTKHFGIGLATGYNHYFAKEGQDGFGTIPVELMFRYYPKAQGIFVGADLGYSFFTNVDNITGGFTIKPEVGYHNYNWNFYAYYNQIFTKSSIIDIQSVGIAASYNIRFK